MATNTLIVSAQENYFDAAKLILEYGLLQNKSIQIVNIEDIVIVPRTIEGINAGGNIYFITNHPAVYTLAAILKLHDYKVINEDYLIRQNSKLLIQEQLRLANLPVPDHGFILGKISDKLRSDSVYLKSFEHTRFSRKFNDRKTLDRYFASIRDGSLYYQEDDVVNKETEEHKLYCVYSKLISPESMPAKDVISKEISKIANELDLEAFSVDIIIKPKNGEHWIIDVNPASSFFGSTEARSEFVNRLMV